MDILDNAAIRLLCRSCNDYYEVPLRDILLSNEIVHCGCPVPHETECPPVFQVRICDNKVVETLETAWRAACHCAELAGGELVLLGTKDTDEGTRNTKEFAEGANDVRIKCA